jgi:hypothetical protein
MSVGAAVLIQPEAGDYWRESARPLVSLVFIAPLLAIYEGGTLWLGSAASRNGADFWLRGLLDRIGFGQYFLLPALACGLLLAWHHARREPWRLGGRTLGQMWLESVAWGAGLLIVGHVALVLTSGQHVAGTRIAAVAAHGSSDGLATRLVGYLGAGIYEELLFRLLLVPPVMALLHAAHFNRKASLFTAVALTSLCFALAHYQFDASIFGWHIAWPHGEPFASLTFTFRFAAGATFALLFSYRGFGIAAGAHALYDLLALLV